MGPSYFDGSSIGDRWGRWLKVAHPEMEIFHNAVCIAAGHSHAQQIPMSTATVIMVTAAMAVD